MKILWISIIVLPKSAQLIGEKPFVFREWIKINSSNQQIYWS